MIEVSREFQEAVRQPVRETRVTGMLRQGTVSFHFGEDAIVQGSLYIVDQMNGGKFGYGSVYSRNVSVKLDYKKIDGLEGVNINLTDMEIGLWFSLKLSNGEWEEIPLGWFCVDSAKSSRKFNILTISGGDYLTKLNQPSAAMTDVTLYEIFTLACGKGYMPTGVTENFVKSLPNGEMKVSFDTAQIQTALDMAMWVAELTGTNVKMNRLPGEPKLVQIPIKYTKSNTAGNFDLEEFKKDNGTIIPANVRFSTEFTDTSVRTTALIMNRKGKQYKGKVSVNLGKLQSAITAGLEQLRKPSQTAAELKITARKLYDIADHALRLSTEETLVQRAEQTETSEESPLDEPFQMSMSG